MADGGVELKFSSARASLSALSVLQWTAVLIVCGAELRLVRDVQWIQLQGLKMLLGFRNSGVVVAGC